MPQTDDIVRALYVATLKQAHAQLLEAQATIMVALAHVLSGSFDSKAEIEITNAWVDSLTPVMSDIMEHALKYVEAAVIKARE